MYTIQAVYTGHPDTAVHYKLMYNSEKESAGAMKASYSPQAFLRRTMEAMGIKKKKEVH